MTSELSIFGLSHTPSVKGGSGLRISRGKALLRLLSKPMKQLAAMLSSGCASVKPTL